MGKTSVADFTDGKTGPGELQHGMIIIQDLWRMGYD